MVRGQTAATLRKARRFHQHTPPHTRPLLSPQACSSAAQTRLDSDPRNPGGKRSPYHERPPRHTRGSSCQAQGTSLRREDVTMGGCVNES